MTNARHDKPKRRRGNELDEAFDTLEREAPGFLKRTIGWMRKPETRILRLPLGALCIAAGFLWFLPVVGLWCLPLGLLLIAEDVPFMRRPVGRMTLYLLDRGVRLRKWWQRKKPSAEGS